MRNLRNLFTKGILKVSYSFERTYKYTVHISIFIFSLFFPGLINSEGKNLESSI